jgi:hypothetical protein
MDLFFPDDSPDVNYENDDESISSIQNPSSTNFITIESDEDEDEDEDDSNSSPPTNTTENLNNLSINRTNETINEQSDQNNTNQNESDDSDDFFTNNKAAKIPRLSETKKSDGDQLNSSQKYDEVNKTNIIDHFSTKFLICFSI